MECRKLFGRDTRLSTSRRLFALLRAGGRLGLSLGIWGLRTRRSTTGHASEDFQRQLTAFSMKGSMSRKGDCWDYAVTETLFGSMKVERLHDMRLPSRRRAKDEVLD